MFKEKGEISTINKILIAILEIICVFSIAMILLLQLNKKSVETHVKETQDMIVNYTTTEENTWDISANGDGSVIAILSEDGTLTISGTGKMKNWGYTDTTDWHNSEIEIKVKNVIINEGVTTIGDNAFKNCDTLKSISMHGGITSIGWNAFLKCSSLTGINIPEGVKSVGTNAFRDCGSLTDINIPEGVTNIGMQSFSGCSSLTSINIPEGVKSIESNTFSNCKSLSNIKIPSSVTSIGQYAFYYCSSLENVEILEGVTSIEGYAYGYCINLKNIKIPSSVVMIGDNTFLGCEGLTEIIVDKNNTQYMDDNGVLYAKDRTSIVKYPEGKQNTTYTILEGVTKVENSAFIDCINLTNINIPEGVTSIENLTFCRCISLTSIKIPSSVTEIGKYAFSGCSGLKSINIPEEVTSIGDEAFSECNSLTKIDVHENNKNYMDSNGVLYTKNKALIIKYPGGKEDTAYTILEGVTHIEDEAFEECNNIISVNIPVGTISIGKRAFRECSNLISISIPESVTSIGNEAFYYCNSLTEINIPEGVTSIGEGAFYKCGNLISITIPSSVESIGSKAFYECEITKLVNKGEKIELPNILQRTQNKDDILYSTNEFLLTNCSIKEMKIIIDENETFAKVYVQGGALEGFSYKISYKEWDISKNGDRSVIATLADDGTLIISGIGNMKTWKYYDSVDWHGRYEVRREIKKIIIEEGVTDISENAFARCSNLTSISIPSSVTSIDSLAIHECNSLMEIKVNENNIKYMDNDGILYTKDKMEIIKYPANKYDIKYTILEGVTSIGKYAFEECNNLTNITIPDSVMSIKWGAFSGCDGLTEITIPKEVTSIEYQAFRNCSSLTSINIPIGITEISGEMFMSCTSLESITIPNNVIGIGNYAFYGCSNLINIIIPSNVTRIGEEVFKKCSSLKEIKVDKNNTVYMDINGILYSKDKTEIIRYPEGKSDSTYTICNSVTSIGKSAFDGCNSLETINIPKELTRIEEYAFSGCKKLLELEISSSVTDIGNKAFNGCSNLMIICEIDSTAHGYAKENETNYLATRYNKVDDYFKGIQPGIIYENLGNKIDSNMKYRITENSKGITGKTPIKTGQQLVIEDRIFTLVVIGDTNGDGQADLKDILAINKHRLNKAKLTSEYLQAGDVNEDKKADLKDILQINKYRLGKISEF